MDFGIRCVISTSFGDIFYNNCFKNGVLPIKVSPEDLDKLFDDAERGANATLSIDLEKQEIRGPDGGVVRFEIDAHRKHCLLNGLDDIGLTMVKEKQINDFEAKAGRSDSRPGPWAVRRRGRLTTTPAVSREDAPCRSYRSLRPRHRRRLDVDHVVEARIDLLRQLPEVRPFLAELRRVVRGLELTPVGPLDVVHDVAAVGAAIEADRYKAGLPGHELGPLGHQRQHFVLIVGRQLDGGDLGHDAAICVHIGHGFVLLFQERQRLGWRQGFPRRRNAGCLSGELGKRQ